jgi:flagellar hook-basal body complex protein FliE
VDVKTIIRMPEVPGLQAPEATPGAKGGSFAGVLKSSLAEVNQLQQKADAAITALATGDKASLHDTMIAMEQADVSFRLMMQVRNKIVEAYQEIMRMQV